MEKSVVLYPGPGVGHLTPMVELAKVFVRHGVSVTVAIAEPQVKSTQFSDAVARAAAANPSVTFHVLPPPASTTEGASLGMFEYLHAMNAPLRDFLRSLPAVHTVVLDMFCAGSLDVTAELGIPAYIFIPSGANFLAIFLNLPSMAASMGKRFSELGDSIVRVPGVPPFKATDIPKVVRDDDDTTRDFLRMAGRIPESNGMLINTLESLEARAVRALRDGLCVPNRPTPPVYCIGPLVSEGGDKKHECLQWLDAQPDSSVVFLSFGSMGSFSKKQLQEIAIGLEKSEQRFLWVVRSPRGEDQKVGDPLPEPDLDALLPEGFLERTKHKGLVVKSWAPQVELLRHRATGAFVTHCGWNSTLEGIMAGLPLLCWPLYAEQRLNKVFIVEEMKLGVELKGYEKDIVEGEEVKNKVRWVMDSAGGRALRERAAWEKDRAAEALKEGGTSHVAFVEFLNLL